jgi:hypothetical protein
MAGFLRANWKWIVIPIVLVLLGIALLILTAENADTSSFQYDAY